MSLCYCTNDVPLGYLSPNLLHNQVRLVTFIRDQYVMQYGGNCFWRKSASHVRNPRTILFNKKSRCMVEASAS